MLNPVCVEPTRASPETVGAVLEDGVQRMPAKASPRQWKVLRALLACRTGALGGSTYRCQQCRRYHGVLFGCGNRHCPDCQGRLAQQWLKAQQSRLLPVPYFHLVFTLPHALNPLIRQNRTALYELLLATASQTLLEFGRNRFQAAIGLTMVLHTWGQRLNEHYHVHAIVTGGGWDEHGGWRQVKNTNYLFSTQALSLVFRGKFCEGLQQLRQAGKLEYHGQQVALKQEPTFQAFMRQATAQRWVVYAKKPFAGPETVLQYFSNYTHRVAISSRRIVHLDKANHQVTFRYRDYSRGSQIRTLQLDTGEFARRFCLHILPRGFCKVRHYGLLGNRGRDQRLEKVRAAIAAHPSGPDKSNGTTQPTEPSADHAIRCPYCGSPRQRLIRVTRPPGHRQPGADSS